MDIIKPSPKPLRLFYFWSGIIATFAYRAIIVLNFYSAVWVKAAWYIGTVGFIVYFWHRYILQKKHACLVEKYQLEEAAATAHYRDEEQKTAMEFILETAKTSKSRFNSAFIFALSIVALAVGIVLDVIEAY